MPTRRDTIAALLSAAPLTSVFASDRLVPPPLRGTHRIYPEQFQDIRSAWLHGETQRYRHFVLGRQFEAGSISILDRRGRHFQLDLPEDAVFEDRIIRMVDLDDDGRTELAVVVSRKGVGSSLALIGLRDNLLRVVAETSPNGRENRWLNPSGVGRFLPGPSKQIVIVRRPHLDASLELYGFDGNGLRRETVVDGYPTHRNGSRYQRLFAVLPGKNGAVDRLVVPAGNRDAIAVLDFSRNHHPEVARYPLPGKADGDFQYQAVSNRLLVPLESGMIAEITFENAQL